MAESKYGKYVIKDAVVEGNVSGRVRSDTALRLFIIQRKHGITGPTYLEGPHFLQVLALKKEEGVQHIINRPAGEHRGAMDKGLDPCMGLSNIVQSRLGSHLRFLCFHNEAR